MAVRGARVAGRKAFISGGAGGLGSAMARGLAAEGAKFGLADIYLEGARSVADDIDATWGAGTAVVDATVVRAHQHAAGARKEKGGLMPRGWVVPAAA